MASKSLEIEQTRDFMKAKKLIEVAMPIKEISSESVRDKSIRHGHISTLHLWWARRPLPVCRAVVFASLVPDPLDENCPQAFRDAVKLLLKDHKGMDAYKPYADIPYTASVDPMEDNLRNRLLMFIGKFSDTYMKGGDKTPAKDKLSDASLIKWDNKNDEEIIGKARKLIWVAHNSGQSSVVGGQERDIAPGTSSAKQSADDLLADFDKHYKAIKDAENDLYSTADRHLESTAVKQKETKLHDAIEAFLDKMPRVFDPFAGGGAIPLEASRLGCRSFGNDINPVAHIIQKGSLEFPQKYGKPIIYSREEFIKRYGEEEFKRVTAENPIAAASGKVKIENRLSFDVEFYAKELLKRVEEEIGHFYPADENGKKPIAYYWARVARCGNPTCQIDVPLLKGFYLVNTKEKQFHLKPVLTEKTIGFEICRGKFDGEGWNQRTNLKCPICGSVTDSKALKEQFKAGQTSERLLAIIEEGPSGKCYRLPRDDEFQIFEQIPLSVDAPQEHLEIGNTRNFNTPGWGISRYGQMFSLRQLLTMQVFVNKLIELKIELSFADDYCKAIVTYLGLWFDRIVVANTSFGVWHTGRETLERIMGRQAIPMVFDYPESNPFCRSSGSALNQLEWLTKYFESESYCSFTTSLQNSSSGEKEQFPAKYLSAVVTDPPYYDAIAYADISDFFYVWLKRTLGDVYPENFATPKTPKLEECTALKHHHNGSDEAAKRHFENKLLQIFDAIEHQTQDVVSVMFAHQSTEAWTTLCNSILGAQLNITGSWAIDSEMMGALKGKQAFLSSSVTVACVPANRRGFGDYKQVQAAIEKKVEDEVAELYGLGFRGADLLTACFGKAVGEFGKYKRVEKASGDEVTVAELLEMTREAAFNALLKGFKGDDFTKFYIGWLELYGFTESDFDDAAKFTKVSLSVDVSELFTHGIFVRNGNRQTLAGLEERIQAKPNLGESQASPLIDQVHRLMWIYKNGNRPAILKFISEHNVSADSSFWRVLTSLQELLPKDIDDEKQVSGLLANKDNLIRESQDRAGQKAQQLGLGFE